MTEKITHLKTHSWELDPVEDKRTLTIIRRMYLASINHGRKLDWMNNFRVVEMLPGDRFHGTFFDRFNSIEQAERFKRGRAGAHHGMTGLLWIIPVMNRHKKHGRKSTYKPMR